MRRKAEVAIIAFLKPPPRVSPLSPPLSFIPPTHFPTHCLLLPAHLHVSCDPRDSPIHQSLNRSPFPSVIVAEGKVQYCAKLCKSATVHCRVEAQTELEKARAIAIKARRYSRTLGFTSSIHVAILTNSWVESSLIIEVLKELCLKC